jgi:hypothetical protein
MKNVILRSPTRIKSNSFSDAKFNFARKSVVSFISGAIWCIIRK